MTSPSPVQALCGHVGQDKRTCVRRPHGDEIRHRYVLSDEQAKQRAGEISRERLEAARSAQIPMVAYRVGRYVIRPGDAVALTPSPTNDHRGWLGVLKDLYEKDGKPYAVVLGAKGSAQATKRERILPADRLVYIRPGSAKARLAKIRAGRPA